jgi:predicted helicase
MKSIHDVLDEFRAASFDERDKGDLFERLVKTFLRVDPAYSSYFDAAWLYSEWAEEQGLPKNDTGIDLVARVAETGDFAAIQCKFYATDAYLDKKEIDSFFTASGKKPFTERLIFSTTDNWSKNAEDAIHDQQIPVTRVRVQDLDESAVDWSTFSLEDPTHLGLRKKKEPFAHQLEAIEAAKRHFQTSERGKLIMACGTGKTYTSLQIVEQMTPKGGTVLFLVPSIALLSQTLKEWKNESKRNFRAYAVCSDTKVGRRSEVEDMSVPDLAYPATTNTRKLAAHFNHETDDEFTVIFSTYQSIDVVASAQANGVPQFDLIICDEAHRTTGVTLAGNDESSFVRVHDNNFIKGSKRLYMTATPRIFADQSKAKAEEASAVLASMDDESLYGKEFHRLNFGQAVSRGLLTDYKVLVLAVSESHVSSQLQDLLAKNGELELSDAIKIVGCYNGLRKRSDSPEAFAVDPHPMKTAVAFARSIKDSKRISDMFEIVTGALNEQANEVDALIAEAEHVDGTFNVLARNHKLDWLKDKNTENTVRILSNARCLSEGVDVPALDAVLFLNPRDSQVDVVQSVGRVMRKSPGKQYGYVILPITVPTGQSPEEALSDHKSYKVVWQVLQALRSHDERFDAIVNKIDLTGNPADSPIQILNVGIGEAVDESVDGQVAKETQPTLWTFDDFKDAIFAKIVQKVGQRTYWENWAKDVAKIAKDHISRISTLVSGQDEGLKEEFKHFLKGLQDNLNPSISKSDAIEMLAQHLITKPVFDALFEGYEFTKLNPVSVSMERMISALERASINKDSEALEGFYESVRLRASGITDGAAKQKIVKELYEKFFRLAFSDTSEKLGIVYTPNEIVDFIINSVDALLRQEFGTSIGAKDVHVIDPFTGTGTFIVRLLQSGLISKEQLVHKFRYELHANEIVLLAYYVAAINIEETFHSIVGEYEPFQGVVLTDTFQMAEGDDSLDSLGVFPDNNERVIKQNALDIRVVIGNPPYSVGQKSENDDNKNMKYDDLDKRILNTYAQASNSSYKNSLYDSYIRAYRWASDRIKDRGIVAFVSNGGWLDSKSADGFRKVLAKEFTSLYIFNLRGNANTQGETRRKEGGGVFGEGSRTPVAITVLVKNPDAKESGQILYHDIGDELSGPNKLDVIAGFKGVLDLPLVEITPNEDGDWLNQRSEEFQSFVPLYGTGTSDSAAIFGIQATGISTNRDVWAYNFNRQELVKNVSNLIANYNENLESGPPYNLDPKAIKWSQGLKAYFTKGIRLDFNESAVKLVQYRPMQKAWLYSDKYLNDRPSTQGRLFNSNLQNLALVTGADGVWVTDVPADLHLNGPGASVLPLFAPREEGATQHTLFDDQSSVYAIQEQAVEHFSSVLGKRVTEEQIFFYCFGILSLPEFQSKFQADLRKVKARVPVSSKFFEIAELGKNLANVQLNYESLEPHLLSIAGSHSKSTIRKMRLSKSDGNWVVDVDGQLKITGIPDAAIDHKIFGRSPLEWVIDRYQISEDKDSGIVNDPNAYSTEPDFILSMLGKAVTMSLKMSELLQAGPKSY